MGEGYTRELLLEVDKGAQVRRASPRLVDYPDPDCRGLEANGMLWLRCAILSRFPKFFYLKSRRAANTEGFRPGHAISLDLYTPHRSFWRRVCAPGAPGLRHEGPEIWAPIPPFIYTGFKGSFPSSGRRSTSGCRTAAISSGVAVPALILSIRILSISIGIVGLLPWYGLYLGPAMAIAAGSSMPFRLTTRRGLHDQPPIP